MKQNILIGALVLVIANLFFLNYHFYMDRQKASSVAVPSAETVSDTITASDMKNMKAELTTLKARLEEKLAEKTQVVIPDSVPVQVSDSGSSRGSAGEGYVGVVPLPNSLKQVKYWVGGRTSFGISHIFAMKGDQCPAGSDAVELPEREQAAAEGVIYCLYWRDSVILNKKDIEKCPFDMRPVEGSAPKRSDEFFCRTLRSDEAAELQKDSEQQRAIAEQKAKEAAAAAAAAVASQENTDEGAGADEAVQSSGGDAESTQ